MENDPRSRFQVEDLNKIKDTSIMENIQIKHLFNVLYWYNYVPELSIVELLEKEYFVKKKILKLHLRNSSAEYCKK